MRRRTNTTILLAIFGSLLCAALVSFNFDMPLDLLNGQVGDPGPMENAAQNGNVIRQVAVVSFAVLGLTVARGFSAIVPRPVGWLGAVSPGPSGSLYEGIFAITHTPFMTHTEATSCRLIQKPCWMLSIPLARPRLRAKLFRRATMPGLTRILLASSPREPSRTRWLRFSMPQSLLQNSELERVRGAVAAGSL